MNIVICNNFHMYDKDHYGLCPVCGDGTQNSPDNTLRDLSNVDTDVTGANKCDKLRKLRMKIGKAYGFNIPDFNCPNSEGCPGTCEKCDAELNVLNEIVARNKLSFTTMGIPSYHDETEPFRKDPPRSAKNNIKIQTGRFCPVCGKMLPRGRTAAMRCKHCGAPIPPKDINKFIHDMHGSTTRLPGVPAPPKRKIQIRRRKTSGASRFSSIFKWEKK